MHLQSCRSKPGHYWCNMKPHIGRGAQKREVAFMRCINSSVWVGVFTLCFSISASQLEQYNLICFMLLFFEKTSSSTSNDLQFHTLHFFPHIRVELYVHSWNNHISYSNSINHLYLTVSSSHSLTPL